jgi:hypothetical protein
MACFAVFFCTAILLAEDYTGQVKNIAKDKTTVTIAVDGSDKTFDFSKDPLVVDDKGKPIPGGLPNVKLGSEVKLYTDKKGDKDVVTTLKVLAPPDPNFKPPANAKGGGPGEYKGRFVSAVKGQVTLKVDNKDKTLDLAKNPMIVDAKGSPIKGGLAKVQPNSEVTFVIEKKGDKDLVTTIKVNKK